MEEDPQHQPQASTCVYMFTCARTHTCSSYIQTHAKQKIKGLNAAGLLDRLKRLPFDLPCPWPTWVSLFFFFSHYCFYFFSQSTTCCTSPPGLSCPATTTNLCQPSLSFLMPKRAQQPLPVLPPTCWSLIPHGVFFRHLFLPLLESRTVILSLCASLDSCELLLHPPALTTHCSCQTTR